MFEVTLFFYENVQVFFFAKESIDYFGHVVTSTRVCVEPHKIEAITKWPLPSSQRQLRGFLALTRYYRRFIKGYSNITAPSTNLLCKDGFEWSSSETIAFEEL